MGYLQGAEKTCIVRLKGRRRTIQVEQTTGRGTDEMTYDSYRYVCIAHRPSSRPRDLLY